MKGEEWLRGHSSFVVRRELGLSAFVSIIANKKGI